MNIIYLQASRVITPPGNAGGRSKNVIKIKSIGDGLARFYISRGLDSLNLALDMSELNSSS